MDLDVFAHDPPPRRPWALALPSVGRRRASTRRRQGEGTSRGQVEFAARRARSRIGLNLRAPERRRADTTQFADAEDDHAPFTVGRDRDDTRRLRSGVIDDDRNTDTTTRVVPS